MYGLPEEKKKEVREWAEQQYNDGYWHMHAPDILEEYGGGICVETTYHWTRMNVPLYIYQLFRKYHDDCRFKVEMWNDMNAIGFDPDEYYKLEEVIDGNNELKEFFSGKTDEEWQKEIDDWYKYLDDNYKEALAKKKKVSCEALKLATDKYPLDGENIQKEYARLMYIWERTGTFDELPDESIIDDLPF